MNQKSPIEAKILSSNASFTEGEFAVAGMKATELAKEFGTPAFIIDEADFDLRANAFRQALENSFGERAGACYYAAKAFISIEIAKWVERAGLSLDVCTGGELEVALAAKFPPERIEFHGNNKSEAEIARAIEVGVGKIVADSEIELERINQIASAKGITQKVLIRVTPGVEAHTHQYIATAHEDVKFGFSIASGAALRAVKIGLLASNLEVGGVHFHIGSQIMGVEGFDLAIERTSAFLKSVKEEAGQELTEMVIGGGFAIAYVAGDESSDAKEVLAHLFGAVKRSAEKAEISMPRVSIEPGRAIVGLTTATLYRVGTVKKVELDNGSRNYVAVDGGMSDNIRTSLYDAEYSVALANRTSSAPLVASRVVGKHCESGDIIVRDCDLPGDLTPGDLLVTPATGAYGRSMASNYNHLPRPPVIAVRDGRARVILRRETHADLLSLEVSQEGQS
ncbi:MAG: diaminopimelate decarboxylase [Actinobacteria bacterium]|nr:diaminopimelate decarboxylase [Actinomycetota bacterium]